MYIYSKTERHIPKPKKVGDIIRLRRFNFVVSENGELVGHHQQYSNWLVYDGEDASNRVISCQDIDKNKNRVLTTEEAKRIAALRAWSQDFFARNSVYQIAWWKGLREPIVPELAIKNKEKASEVDLVLCTVSVSREEKKVTFNDSRENTYYLILHAPPVLQKGDVIKLKCVDVFFTKEGRYVRLTTTTSCLQMSPNTLDAQTFSKGFPSKKLPILDSKSPFNVAEDEDNYYTTRKRLLERFPFLAHFDFEQELINKRCFTAEKKPTDIVSQRLTLITKSFVNRIPANLDVLSNLLSNEHGANSLDMLHQRFVIRAQIQDIVNHQAPSFIKKHCDTCSKTAPINTGPFECCGSLMDLFFHLVFLVGGEGSNGEQVQLPVYVVVGKDSHLFDLWELIPRPDDYEGFLEWKEAKTFNKKMRSFKATKKKADLVVELKSTVSGSLFLSLVETILLP